MKVSSLKCCTNHPIPTTHPSLGKPRNGLPSIATACKGDYISLPSDGRLKKSTLCIQEIRVDNNKWLVFNEETQQQAGSRTWGLASLRRKAPTSKKQGKREGDLSVKENLRFETDFPEKRPTVRKLQSSLLKLQQKWLKKSQTSEKLRTSRKVTLADKEQAEVRGSPSPSNSRFKNYSKSNKSSKSVRSIGSSRAHNQAKGKQKEQITTNVSILNQKTQEIANFHEEAKLSVNCADRYEAQAQKRILLARVYDSIELLNPDLNNRLCTDFYLDFPQWKFPNPPIMPPPLQNQQIVQEAIPSLSPEPQACIEGTISKSVDPSRASTILPVIQPLPEQSLPCMNEQQPLPEPKLPTQLPVEKVQGKAINQCLTTNSTELHQKSQASNTEIQSLPLQQTCKSPQVFPSIKQQSFRDKSFDQLGEFSSFKQVRLIQIDHNYQTALLPSKFSSQFLFPIPSTSSLHRQFKNDQIISFLNHLIFAQPQLIHEAFQPPSRQGFSCNFYVNGERQRVTVDGLFPFDANYYPIYGSFDQFIWFSVMTKCIAKLKGSYAAINSLNQKDIYEMLRGATLLLFDVRAHEYKALKQLKILVKNSQQSKSTLLMAKNQRSFFKILKIECIKPIPKVKQIYINQYSNKTTASCEENFKSLNNFLKKEIKVCEKNQLHQNTAIYLKGFNSRRKMTFKDFIDEGFEVLVSADIQKALTDQDIKLQGLSLP